MSLTYSLGEILGMVSSISGRSGFGESKTNSTLDQKYVDEQFRQATQEFRQKIQETKTYAREADKRYVKLIQNKFETVPAIELYTPGDGGATFTDELMLLQMQFNEALSLAKETSTSEDASSQLSELKTTYDSLLATSATQIQTFLREDTSDLECAKIWDAKFIKAANEHIPPHDRKGECSDSTMSLVMAAYRRWAETDAYTQQFFGSQNLINVTYEAVLEGYDAFDYMGDIINLASQEIFGGVENEYDSVIVPNAEFSLFG